MAIGLLIGSLADLKPVFAGASACHDAFRDEPRVLPESIPEKPKSASVLAVRMTGEAGRVMLVEVIPPSRAEAPLFVMMPGMNRAGRLSDASVAALVQAGYGVAELNFSVHPFSVGALERNETPYFRKRSPTLKDFANEADFVVQSLREKFGTQNVIPVSLSFSGAVTPLMREYPLIIETVPMTSEKAVNAEGAAYRATLKAGEIFNPIFGPAISRSLMDQAYRAKWAQQAEGMIEAFGLPPNRKVDIVDGYVALSRSAEDATWEKVKIPASSERVFILAERESPALLLNQLQTFQRLYLEGNQVSLFVVASSGHIIPVDQPVLFAKVLESVTMKNEEPMRGVRIVQPDGKIEKISKDETAKWIEDVIKSVQETLRRSK